MNLRLKGLMIASLFLVLGVVTPVLAQETTTTEETPTTTTTDKDTVEARQKRVEEYKKKFTIKPTTTEQKLIKDRCKNAQANLGTLGDKVNSNLPKRNKSFENLLTHLDKLLPKLKAKGVDTTKLEEQRAQLEELTDAFKADLEVYHQNLKDLKNLECANDPVAFKAALEAARASRTDLKSQLEALATLVKTDIKATLQAIRAELAKTTEGDN